VQGITESLGIGMTFMVENSSGRFAGPGVVLGVALAVASQSLVSSALAETSNAATALAQSITIQSDKTQLISIMDKPGTVVVGNPSIADISVNGTQIFLHGHGFGNTNIFILDNKGELIANYDVTVEQAQSNAVSLFRGVSKFSYACSPTCESTLQVGDSAEWFKVLVEQQAAKNALASGSETTEAKAPTAPQ
jgi:Flp pilus assembly secretin CpaC